MIRDTTHNAIEGLLAQGDIAAAAARAEAALAAGEEAPLLLNLAAWAREEAGDFDAARALLARALALAPGDPFVLVGLAAIERRLGRLAEAVRAIDASITAAPANPAAWLERGYILDAGNSIALAIESYRRAAELDPTLVPALAGVATLAARAGDPATARDFAGRALARDPGDATATVALARLDLEEGKPDAAAERLRPVAARALLPGVRLQVQGLLGDALARSGEPDAAFAAYDAANAAWRELHARLAAQTGTTHLELVEGVIAGVDASPSPWPPLEVPPAPGAAARHIVLCGYPRSGNTLVENVLASLPGVEAIEERPTLADGDGWLDPSRLPALATIGPDEAMALRASYWRKVAACGVNAGAAALVDMDPLKSVQLPLIARLFPEARVILMRRDPRDVVWSCFHTNFAPNLSTFEFSELERAARHYDAVMRLTELCLARLPLNALVVHYEALVGDFDAETRRICDFAGLAWTADLRRFDRTARARGVSTASVTQVRQGLYNGAGQWRPFAAHMASVMPILRPWVERFGYAE